MNTSDIIDLRLANQQLVDTKLNSPQEVVKHLLAMQAQEFAHAKWAIALRLPEGITDATIEKVYNDGGILRTHVMRPTWHFVCPEDIRWLLKLTGTRVTTLNSFMYRKSGLDHSTFNQCNDIMVKLLEGGKSLSRNELNKAFTAAGIIADGHRD